MDLVLWQGHRLRHATPPKPPHELHPSCKPVSELQTYPNLHPLPRVSPLLVFVRKVRRVCSQYWLSVRNSEFLFEVLKNTNSRGNPSLCWLGGEELMGTKLVNRTFEQIGVLIKIFSGNLLTKGLDCWVACPNWPGIISGDVWHAWMSGQVIFDSPDLRHPTNI